MIFLCSVWLATSIIFYIKNNHILGLLFAKVTGNISKKDEIRRKNISADIKHKKMQIYDVADKGKKKNKVKAFIEKTKKKVNSLIFYTGLLNIPGFSTTSMFLLLTIVVIFVFLIATLLRELSLGITLAAITVFFFFYGLSMIKYRRRNKLEGQLLQFINDVTSASLQYVNIIDKLK